MNLQSIQSKIAPKAKGGLGSRNYNTFAVSVEIAEGLIWCVSLHKAIYRTKAGFNESVELSSLADDVLSKIDSQLN